MCLSVQMTSQEVRLCGLLLREHFGEVVEKVGTHLLGSGAQNLRTIIHETGTSLDLVPVTVSTSHPGNIIIHIFCSIYTAPSKRLAVQPLCYIGGQSSRCIDGVMCGALHIMYTN